MTRRRLRITIQGAVQGVGFRPFVHRLARDLDVGGWVRNEGADVLIEAETDSESEAAGKALAEFLRRLPAEAPDAARIASVHSQAIPPRGERTLVIAPSRDDASPRSVVPDLVTCEDCRAEVLDPDSRYFGHPFTNCTRCGPRFTIVRGLPYDRANTSMAGFPMCRDCRAEFDDPASRRFHAQPTSCPACGPRLCLTDPEGSPLRTGAAALEAAAERLRDGEIVALKGLGGYQLLVDATLDAAVARLRRRKHRPHKPLAVMVPDLAAARALCEVDPLEEALLSSAAGPIVLLRRRGPGLCEAIHPDQAEIGLMLPTTPLHHLLLRTLPGAVVCTSGNRGGEPLCIDDEDARARLGDIADVLLGHDRPILRPVDDSVARVIDGAPQVLRLGRGHAPMVLPSAGGPPSLATGAQQKNALALHTGERIVAGPHVGDLENTRAVDAMRAQADDLQRFFSVTPERTVCDLHPDYASTGFANQLGPPTIPVQHHLAHALAAMLEHGLKGPILAVVWDGTGLGTDGTVWGGEFLRVERRPDGVRWERVAHLRRFRLPGGDAASREPERALAGLRFEMPDQHDRIPGPLRPLLEGGIHAPWCTSAGRLFEGVAAQLGLGEAQSYQGMAASRLEREAGRADGAPLDLDPLALVPGSPSVLDWAPTLRSLVRRQEEGHPVPDLSAAFHRALAAGITRVATMAEICTGPETATPRTTSSGAETSTVVLTGGCFQNRQLSEETVRALRDAGLEVLLARRLPPNDGGIAVGQLAAVTGVHEDVSGDPRSHR